ncbi:MAG: hypothetical protein J6A01_05130 [Proteobacteria bacterium]|nr:hypothetical protein [Pseudomonadota bacterium]
MNKLILLLTALLTQGCLYVAPIDEEPEPDDTMPFINEASPGLGVVEINLENSSPQQFILSSYDDANADQALYSRIVLDYRPAGATSNPIKATIPVLGDTGSRDSLTYELRPCELAKSQTGVFEEGKTIDLYFVIADERFFHENTNFLSTDFSLPFKTYTNRGSVWVQWTLLFKGKCRSDL